MIRSTPQHNAESANRSTTTLMPVRITCDNLDVAEEDSSRGTSRIPPWRDDSQIYASRFIIAAFWGSQAGILAVGTLIVFYRGIFFPLSITGFSRTETSLQTESWIWFIVGCYIAAFLGIAIILLIGGAMFSSLFVIYDDGIVDGDEEP